MKRSSILRFFLIGAIISVLMVITGCSEYSKDEKKAYKAIEKYQQEHFPESNKELEIEYSDLKDVDPDSIIEGKTEYGEDTWLFVGTYTYNHEKVPGMENADQFGEDRFDASVKLVDGEYVVDYYTEMLNVRKEMDNY